jgi:hypothetical protein
MKTPQSNSCWVWEYLFRWQGTIAAPRGPGESGLQQVCESHFDPQQTTETSAGARRPWLRRSFAMERNQYKRGDGDCEEEGEK